MIYNIFCISDVMTIHILLGYVMVRYILLGKLGDGTLCIVT